MKVAWFPLATGLLCGAALGWSTKVPSLPRVRVPSSVYASRDVGRINEVLDDFDSQAERQRIDLDKPGYVVELRLLKENE